jgi:uracil-DNA glycosylase
VIPLRFEELYNSESKKPYFQQLMEFVNQSYREMTVYPPKEELFRAFGLCPLEDAKVVILGQDPYHNKEQANGLAFSVRKGVKIPPSLRNIFKEMVDDLHVSYPSHGDLTSWAEQGVLLMNTILSVEENKPLSHANKGWEQFTNQVLCELNKSKRPIIFIFWGREAQKKARLITNEIHQVMFSSHPSPLSARHSFFGSKLFSKINHFLEQTNQKKIDFEIK